MVPQFDEQCMLYNIFNSQKIKWFIVVYVSPWSAAQDVPLQTIGWWKRLEHPKLKRRDTSRCQLGCSLATRAKKILFGELDGCFLLDYFFV